MPNDTPTPSPESIGITVTIAGPKAQVDRLVDLIEDEYELAQETQYTTHPDPAAAKLGVVAAGVFLKPAPTIVAPGASN